MSTKEYLQRMREVEKQASFLGSAGTAMKGFGTDVMSAARGGAVLGIGGALTVGVGQAAAKTWDAITKHQDFNAMIGSDLNQDVKAHYQADPTRVNQMFTTLRTMNPQFSKDPLVAGSYLRRMLDAPHAAGGVATEALTHRDAFPAMGMEAFTRGALEGGKAHVTESIKNKFNQPNADREFDQRNQQFDKQLDFNRSREEANFDQRRTQFERQQGFNEDRAVMDARAPFYPPTNAGPKEKGSNIPGRRPFINKYKR